MTKNDDPPFKKAMCVSCAMFSRCIIEVGLVPYDDLDEFIAQKEAEDCFVDDADDNLFGLKHHLFRRSLTLNLYNPHISLQSGANVLDLNMVITDNWEKWTLSSDISLAYCDNTKEAQLKLVKTHFDFMFQEFFKSFKETIFQKLREKIAAGEWTDPLTMMTWVDEDGKRIYPNWVKFPGKQTEGEK